LADIVAGMALPVKVHHGRAEALLAGGERFDALVVRAVARLSKLLEWFAPHADRFGRMLLVKGPSWVDERGEARHRGLMHGLALRKLADYKTPGTEAESVLLEIARKTA
ncbi:MAG: class I SAM-dependent methyltransferase, partial [Pirellulales bacterium]|nr:class I SAM-dependent methyltransferase [Pirellulales bacterium]